MFEFIAKYWLEFAFGLVAACIVFSIRQYYSYKSKLGDKEQEEFKEEIIDTINNDMCEQMTKYSRIDNQIQEDINNLIMVIDNLTQNVLTIQQQMVIDNVTALKAGVLSMQGKIFKEDCRRLLEPNHIITEEEYEDIVADHKSYNGLDGNHIGDGLFKSVMNKWDKQIELSLKDKK